MNELIRVASEYLIIDPYPQIGIARVSLQFKRRRHTCHCSASKTARCMSSSHTCMSRAVGVEEIIW